MLGMKGPLIAFRHSGTSFPLNLNEPSVTAWTENDSYRLMFQNLVAASGTVFGETLDVLSLVQLPIPSQLPVPSRCE